MRTKLNDATILAMPLSFNGLTLVNSVSLSSLKIVKSFSSKVEYFIY